MNVYKLILIDAWFHNQASWSNLCSACVCDSSLLSLLLLILTIISHALSIIPFSTFAIIRHLLIAMCGLVTLPMPFHGYMSLLYHHNKTGEAALNSVNWPSLKFISWTQVISAVHTCIHAAPSMASLWDSHWSLHLISTEPIVTSLRP